MERNIENLITNTISELKNILDISSIIGEPIKIGEIVTIIPICKMTMGLVSGGSDVGKDKLRKAKIENYVAGSGTGLSYVPIGVITIVKDAIKYIPLGNSVPYYDIANSIEKIVGKLIDKMEDKNDKSNK